MTNFSCDRDRHDGRQRVRGAIVAERLDDSAAIDVLTAQHEAGQRLLDRRLVAVRRERARQRGPDEFAVFFVERFQQAGRNIALRIVLEIGIRHRAQAIVGLVERGAHHVPRARIVEAREQHERAKADVSVGMARRRFDERRNGLCRRRATDEASRRRARRRVELPEGINRRLELRRRGRLIARRLLRRERGRAQQCARQRLPLDHSTALSASCR